MKVKLDENLGAAGVDVLLPALEPARVDIGPAAEERAEERDLRV